MNAFAAIEDVRVRSWNKCNTSLPNEDFHDLINNIIKLTKGKLPKTETIDRLIGELAEQTTIINDTAQESMQSKKLKMQDYINERNRAVSKAQKNLDDKNSKTNALFKRILDTDKQNLRQIDACKKSLNNLKSIFSLYDLIQKDIPYLNTNYNNMKRTQTINEYTKKIQYISSNMFISNKDEQIDKIKKIIEEEEHKTYDILPEEPNSFINNSKDYENKVKELLDFCNKTQMDNCEKVLLNLQRIRCWNVYFKTHKKLVRKIIEADENVNIDKNKLDPISFNSQNIELSFRQKIEQIVTHTLTNVESLSIESFFQKCIQNATGIKEETQSDTSSPVYVSSPISYSKWDASESSPVSPSSLHPPPLVPPPLTPPPLTPPLSPLTLPPPPLTIPPPATSVASPAPRTKSPASPSSRSDFTPQPSSHEFLMTTIQCKSMSNEKLSTLDEEKANEEIAKRKKCATAAIQNPRELHTLLKQIFDNCEDDNFTDSCKKIKEIYKNTVKVSKPVSPKQRPIKSEPVSPKQSDHGKLVTELLKRELLKRGAALNGDDDDPED